MSRSPSAIAVRILSLAMGVFLLAMGLDKLGWFADSDLLVRQLQQWRGSARPLARSYLDTLAIPGAPLFARLIPPAELAAGTALLLGIRVRLAAALALVMIVNFHIAADVMFRLEYLRNGYGPPILGALLALVIGGRQLPFSLSKA
jgi:uncharacterized membrane protein YphA (DoxX/SURF4 family)